MSKQYINVNESGELIGSVKSKEGENKMAKEKVTIHLSNHYGGVTYHEASWVALTADGLVAAGGPGDVGRTKKNCIAHARKRGYVVPRSEC